MTFQRSVSLVFAVVLTLGVLGCPADDKKPATPGAAAASASGVPAAGSAPPPGQGQGW